MDSKLESLEIFTVGFGAHKIFAAHAEYSICGALVALDDHAEEECVSSRSVPDPWVYYAQFFTIFTTDL